MAPSAGGDPLVGPVLAQRRPPRWRSWGHGSVVGRAPSLSYRPRSGPAPSRREVWPALQNTAALAGYFGIETVIRAALAAQAGWCDAVGRAARKSPGYVWIGVGIVVPEGYRRCVAKGSRVFSCSVVS